MNKKRDVQSPHHPLRYSILLFASLGLIFFALTLFNISIPLVWWIVLFLVLTIILFGSHWCSGLAMWFAMIMKGMGNR